MEGHTHFCCNFVPSVLVCLNIRGSCTINFVSTNKQANGHTDWHNNHSSLAAHAHAQGEMLGEMLGRMLPGWHVGQDPGWDVGQDPGWDVGQDPGWDVGQDPGWDVGQDPGWDVGQDPGWDVGWDAASDACGKLGGKLARM